MSKLKTKQDTPIIDEKQTDQVIELIQELLSSYTKKTKEISDESWAKVELRKHLPEISEREISRMSYEIISSVQSFDENLNSLETAVSTGTSKEKWFHDKIQEASVGIEVNRVGQYLQEIDLAIANSNDLMQKTITNMDGSINQNKNLDGFIFEQHHANTFNMDAALKGSEYRAEALQPKPGEAYKKNSIDMVIKDEFGKIAKKYQAKFYEGGIETNNSFKKGYYPFQGKLVAKNQTDHVPNSTDHISIGKVKSSSLSKEDGKMLQQLAQEGKTIDVDWNYYKVKDLTKHMTQNVAFSSLQSASVAVGFDIVQKKLSGQKIDGDEVIELALETGLDSGIKNATTVGLKIASEKGLISLIPKGTPAGIIANVACIAIENIKVAGKVASGELTVRQGLEKMERVTVSSVAGIACSGIGALKGATIGAAALSWIPVIGPVVGGTVGGLVGGTVAYMAGSTVGDIVSKGVQKIRTTAVNVVKSGIEAVGNAVSSAWNSFKSIFS